MFLLWVIKGIKLSYIKSKIFVNAHQACIATIYKPVSSDEPLYAALQLNTTELAVQHFGIFRTLLKAKYKQHCYTKRDDDASRAAKIAILILLNFIVGSGSSKVIFNISNIMLNYRKFITINSNVTNCCRV